GVGWRAGGVAPPTEAIAWEALSPQRARLRVQSPAPTVLVLADLYWPGWRVTVDGEQRPVLRADYLFRGVAVEPGDHEVEFSYAPASLRRGALLSLVTLGALAVFVVRQRRRALGGAAS